MKPLIFLDIDGVLATNGSIVRSRGKGRITTETGDWYPYHFEPNAVDKLNDLIEKADADIVVSSTWRRGHTIGGLQSILENEGVNGTVIDKTPYLQHQERGHEIQFWLDECPKYDGQPFVILDDDTDMAHLKPYLVQTSFMEGLTRRDVKRALSVLARWERAAA